MKALRAAKNGHLVGVNVIPGEPHRRAKALTTAAELGGIAGIVEALQVLSVKHMMMASQKEKVEVGLDGKQAMKEEFDDWPLDPGRPGGL